MLKSDFNLTYKQLLYDISYQNLSLLSRCIPSYNIDKKGGKGKQNKTKINGNDPKNKEAIDRELELLG